MSAKSMQSQDVVMLEKNNKTVTEKISINKLTDSVLRTGLVEPDIRENDKTPSWDGELRLYKSKDSFSKANLVGSIPIQVKGTCVERFSKGKATFQAEVADLQNYLHGGGVMFFLVQIKNFDNFKIYYASLLPFDLRKLLDTAANQKTKQIKLEQFPHKYRDGILRILSGFITNKEKQGTLLPNIRSILDLDGNKMEVEKLEIPVSNIGLKTTEDVYEEMLHNPLYIYAKPKNVEASFVIDKVLMEKIITHRSSAIEVNGEILHVQVDHIRKSDGIEQIVINNNLVFTTKNSRLNFDYSLKGTLTQQIQTLTIINAFVQGQCVKFENQELSVSDLTLDNYTPDELAERLSMFRRAQEALTKLRVKKELEFDGHSANDLQKLSYLVAGVLDQTPLPTSVHERGGVRTLRIYNIKLLLSLKKCNGVGCIISNFFDAQELVLAKDGDDPREGVPVSPYIIVDVNFLDTIDNLNLEEIVPSITRYPYSNTYGQQIILLVLELLKFYDNNKNNDILNIVTQLLEYIRKNDCAMEDLCKINQLQTEKRRRSLTGDENQYLVSLKQPGTSLPFQLAANILLGSFSEAQLIYDQLGEKEREEFDKYPIKNLWTTV